MTYLNVEIGPKLLELLHEVVPTATTMAALVNPTNPNADILSKSLQVAARTLGLELHVLKASTERDIDIAFDNPNPTAGWRARHSQAMSSSLHVRNSSLPWRFATRCRRSSKRAHSS